jgi:RND family efflux transporter MFP subunit
VRRIVGTSECAEGRLGRVRLAWLALLLALAGCGESEVPAPPPAAPEAVGDDVPVEVTITKVRRGSIVQRVSAPGSLVARRESHIGPQVRGTIERIHVSEGDRVEEGDVLFEIDPTPYEVALRQAEAGLDLARSERHQLEADLARARELLSKEVMSEQAIERLVTSVEVAHARERQAAEAVARARQNLDWTVVRAPYAGSVAARLADEGTTALDQPQTVVIVLQETDVLEARAGIPESQLLMVNLGDPALLHVEGIPEPILTEVSAVSDTIDPSTRTYLVKMLVDNSDRRLKAGIFVRVEIVPRAKEEVLVVPRKAIYSEDGVTQVLRVREGRAVASPVQLGIVSEEQAEVLRGLRVDDEVILEAGEGRVAPGMHVRVRGGDGGAS